MSYTRLWIGSTGKVKKLWIQGVDADGVFATLNAKYGAKVFNSRPKADYAAKAAEKFAAKPTAVKQLATFGSKA